MKQNYIEKEWQQLQKTEKKYLSHNENRKIPGWQEFIARYVPEKLEDTLNDAFYKGFQLIFEKGTGIIEKTYRKEKKEQDYKIHEYTAEVRDNRKSFRAFGRAANAGRRANMAVSTVEGVGMGLFGWGIPDIPLFLGVLFKSIYEMALSYGFSYDTEEEQIFILKLIETALSHDHELTVRNMELNLWMREGKRFEISREEQMRRTSDALSKEMLYLKFVQGAPVVGIIGGVSDVVYQKKISDYAAIKYKRRFLVKKRILQEA